jgi:N-sulfoglucosamine sulfohydrolase
MSQAQPNVILLHSHNTGRLIQPYGHPVPTPNIQRLAEQGVLFRQAFAAAPTCSPSRASLSTGQYPHVNGMLGLAHRGFRLKDYDRTMVHTLNAAGYRTVLGGLQHITKQREELAHSDDLNPASNKAADVIPGVVKFLDTRPGGPFYLDVGINETHRPFPEATAEEARYTMPPAALPDTPRTRQDFAGFKRCCRIMDDAFGQVLDALKRNGLEDNTLVICYSDHGAQFPFYMCNLTDRGLETFMVIRGPRGFTGGKVIDAMISHVDIFPTVCELAGINIPNWVQGRSIMPLMDGRATDVNEEIYGEITYHAAYEPQRCIRTRRWKYIRRCFDDRVRPTLPNIDRGPSRDEVFEHGFAERTVWQEALYDVMLDPMEMDNRAGDPQAADVLRQMRQRLDKWMDDTDDPLLKGPVALPKGCAATNRDGLHPMDGVRLEPC